MMVLRIVAGVGFLGLASAAVAFAPPDVDPWIAAVAEQRDWIGKQDPGGQEQAARKALFEMRKAHPVLVDWVLQDAEPSGFSLLLPVSADAAEKTMLAKLGVTVIPESSAERLALYAERCLERRERRLRPVIERWSPFAFSEMHSIYMSFIGYTEGLSDARAERFFKPGTKLTLLHFDEGSVFGRPEHLIDDPHGVIRDVDVSYDTKRLLFAWKQSDRLDDYHIYEYDLQHGAPRQVTFGLGRADYEPAYLPDGDIVFASTRPEQSVPCWWTEISNLYRMNAEGGHIRRLAIDQVHTLYPQVLNDGRICYTRWDYSDRGQNYPHPVFSMDPDGQAQRVYYGGNSWFPTSLLHTRAIPGSEKVMSIAAGHHTRQHGKLVVVDVRKGRDEGAGLHFISPKRDVPYERIDVAQQHGDQFRYPLPLSETELLVSYVPDWGYLPDDPELRQGYDKRARYADLSDYGLYWMNDQGDREYLYGDATLGVQRPVALGHREAQPVIRDTVDYTQKTGTLYVHDVYKGVGLDGIPRGQARKIRVVRLNYRAAGVGMTLNQGEGGGSINSSPVAIGNGSWDVKEILGDVDIHADGSALFEVPADESIYLQVIDERGRVIQTTRTWDTIRPGEQKACVGCHDKANANYYPFKKEDTLAWSQPPQKLEPFYGETRGFSFQKEVQPILDRACVSCHDGADGNVMDLRGIVGAEDATNKRRWTRSYLNLTGAKDDQGRGFVANDPEGGMVSWISKMSRPTELPPYFAGAAKSPMLKMLDEGHHGVKLSEEEYHKVAAWMDLLVPFTGEYREGHYWADHEMRKYDYYEKKREHQKKEELREIAAYLGSLGDPRVDDVAVPFIKARYHAVWTSRDLDLAAGQDLVIAPDQSFLFDRIVLRAEAGPSLILRIKPSANAVQTGVVLPDGEPATWHSGGAVYRSGDIRLVADRDVRLTSVEIFGVEEDQLPELNGYKPHLDFTANANK